MALLLGDSHVHNGFSACRPTYSPVEEVWALARARGVDWIGLSNHCDPMNRRGACEHVRQTRTEIETRGLTAHVKQGVELNINADPDHEGRSDLFLPGPLWELLDYVNMGEHLFFNMMGGFLASSVDREDWDAVDEYFAEKTTLIRDAFQRYPEQAGGAPPARAVWVHPWLWETQNGIFLPARVFEHTAPLVELMVNRGIAFELNGFLFRTYDFPAPPLRQQGSFAEHYAAVVRYYTDLVRRIHAEFPALTFTLGSDAHQLAEIGDLFVPRYVAWKAGLPKSRLLRW